LPTSNYQQLPFLGFGSEEALREIADALPDGLFMTDPEGKVTFWNRAATAITGWTREEALGRSCSILAGDAVNGCSCGVGPIRCGLAVSGKSSKCCTIRTKDGRQTLVVKNAVPILAPDGTATGALETFTDVGSAAGFERIVGDPRLAGAPPAAPDFHGLVGRHPAMLELQRMIGLVARSDSTVMILGESGSGKERVAEAIHRTSARAAGPFVKVSCSALNENLLESELFGHVKGAFTGALRDRRGRFQEADGGTLLLDEIGDISPVVQVKLLRVIEQREIERVGESQTLKVDVRLLCATHRDLKGLVREGRFRADLFFRLAVFPLRVPPLREHVEDLRLLAERFLARSGSPRRLSAGALAVLEAHGWPGNVRELQNVLEYAALQAVDGEIRPEHLPADVGAAVRAGARRPVLEVLPGGVAADAPEDGVERAEVLAALERHGWNRTRAAEALGISRVTLWKRLKRLGLSRDAEDGDADGPE
jgi:PAS domain S-box-containing protein